MKKDTLRLQAGWRQMMKESYETCQQHEAEFVEEAEEKHSDSLRSAVNGNCSARLKRIMLVNVSWK